MTRTVDPAEPFRYDLFTLLRRAERERPDHPRIGEAGRRNRDLADLAQDPFFAFPASNVVRAGVDEAGRLSLAVQFLGLMGPMGALPLSVTEEAYQWQIHDDEAFARFLDIFNNRFIQLFYRAWADARPIAQHDRPDDDRFMRYVGAVVGLGLPAPQPPGAVADIAKTAYAGLLSARVKSASRLRSFLAGLFAVDVEVEEFVPTALALAPEDQSRLGMANSALGVDLMAGRTVLTFDEKIRIRVTVGSLGDYASFLPTGPNAVRLADAIDFYLGDELDWDIELALPTHLAPSATLGVAGQLGWTGWLNPQHQGQDKTVLADARFRPPGPTH
ncbi:type VI secretion system baseplate subunit TssG [Acuticoccus sp. MNP-M23]|uniref:type VI secretion system baseplate subunit TssG n=1 Tax=Acuticoccus sp. MNP-M23 TaxID=3072793 RepID=UPI0028158C70|nr:type VI secretion system baseplate subunit TssG [Acuticoccus sp. MNP-M23]WMS44088.1 type VI secretion system baseplate subunit TssG [Acuticoccus sp. MNP-M23]